MSPLISIDLGHGLSSCGCGCGVNIIYKKSVELRAGETNWLYIETPTEIDSDCPEEPGEEINLLDYALPGADENGIYDEYLSQEEFDVLDFTSR